VDLNRATTLIYKCKIIEYHCSSLIRGDIKPKKLGCPNEKFGVTVLVAFLQKLKITWAGDINFEL